MAAWVVNVDFQGGAGWEDISSGVILTSFVRRRQIWNKLAPTVNTLDFKLKTESSTLIAKFMVAASDILVSVTKDGSAYFTGMVQPNYSVTVGGRISPFDISCVDNGYRIQRRVLANINWTDYKVCDPSTPAASIVHQLMVAAGLSAADVYSSITTIDKTIDRFVAVANEDEVWSLMKKVLFDFGYVFYFRPDGTLDVFDFAPSSIVTTDHFTSDPADTKNIIGTLRVERNVHDYEAVRVGWSTHKTLVNALLFSDTTNGDAVRKCNIAVASAAYWPTDADSRDIYAGYKPEGYELIATSNVALHAEYDVALVEDTFTDEITRAKIKYHNSGSTSAYIWRFDIIGDAVVKDQYNFAVRVMNAGTNKYLDLDSNYLYTEADAEKLADAVAQYYYNADMTYTLVSRDEYDPGAYVYVEEKGFLDVNNLCVVREVADVEFAGQHSYILEGVAEYSAGPVTSSGNTEPPTQVQRPSGYVIGVSGFAGFADAYLDGTADETEINAGIALQNGLGGGTVTIVGGGTVVLGAAIELLSNVTLNIEPGVVIEKNCNDYAVECVGSSGTHNTNVRITGGGTITRNAADENAVELVHFEYVDDFVIDNVTADDSYEDGIYIINCANGKVEAGVKISACDGTGLKIIASTVIIAAAITITTCAIGCEMWPSIATDVMYHGDCESTDEPMLDNETEPYLEHATWARSDEQKRGGAYSYKLTKSEAGIQCTATFADSISPGDMHGFTAGKSYLLGAWIYIPTGIDAAHVHITLLGNGTGNSTQQKAAALYDQWQQIKVIHRFADDTTYAYALVSFTNETTDEYIYVDDVVCYEYDDTDSGCQLANSSVDSCTDTGVIVANSHAIVQNNQITGNTNAGLVIQCGYRNLVTNNRCYNNGDDTGLGNENSDNFYDGGVDTQLSGNSWQSPVVDEPSWGTFKEHLYDSGATNPADANVHSLDLSGEVPVGANGVEGYITMASGTVGDNVIVTDSTGTNVYGIARAAVASVTCDGWFKSPLTSDRLIYYQANNATVTSQRYRIVGYYS